MLILNFDIRSLQERIDEGNVRHGTAHNLTSALCEG